MKTANIAQFDQSALEQAIAGAQAMIESLPYMGKKARKVAKEFTVKAEAAGITITDTYMAYDIGDAMNQFSEDYGIRADTAYRTVVSK